MMRLILLLTARSCPSNRSLRTFFLESEWILIQLTSLFQMKRTQSSLQSKMGSSMHMQQTQTKGSSGLTMRTEYPSYSILLSQKTRSILNDGQSAPFLLSMMDMEEIHVQISWRTTCIKLSLNKKVSPRIRQRPFDEAVQKQRSCSLSSLSCPIREQESLTDLALVLSWFSSWMT